MKRKAGMDHHTCLTVLRFCIIFFGKIGFPFGIAHDLINLLCGNDFKVCALTAPTGKPVGF